MKDVKSKIEDALSRSVCGGWDRGFLESVLEQINKGKTLSTKQKNTLTKVLERNDEANQALHDNWSDEYKNDFMTHAKVLAQYHTRQPYYREMAKDILNDHVPERKRFLRMFNNKYSKKVLSQHAAANKYEVGDYLLPRSSFNSYKHVEMPNDMVWAQQNNLMQRFIKQGGFVLEVLAHIRSAAKGAKRYRLLPVGERVPIIVEERFLKKGRRT